jgi:peptide/nickel transport system substrate-binding protein
VACGTPAAETLTVEVTVEVTVIVPADSETIVVTATPEAEEEVSIESDDPSTYLVATFGDAETFDPALNYESAGAGIIQNTYETLVTYNREDASELVPQLAESFEISDDGTVYTFAIRKGIMFHEGQELSPEDVAYSFQRGLLQGGPDSPQLLLTEPFLGVGVYDVPELIDPELSGDPEGLQAVDADELEAVCEQVKAAITVDGDSVVMTLEQPWSPFLSTLAGGWGAVMSKEWVIENGGWDGECDTWQDYYGITSEEDPFTSVINGTGPFKLERWTQGEEIVLLRNDDYWRNDDTGPVFEGAPVGPAAVERVVIQGIDEWGTRFAMLQAGDADNALVPPENVTQVDPLVGERCDYNFDTLGFDCAATENKDAALRLYIGAPQVIRTDAMFVFEVNDEGGNNFIGSGELDGNGIPKDFFSDINVRRGFNYCFDWEIYIEDALVGEAVQGVGPIIPGMVGYNPDGPAYSYDPDKCAEELEQAWDGAVAENGFRMQVAYNTGNTTRQTIAEILQANLADVNENYVIETIGLPWPSFLGQIRESRLPLYISGWHEDIHDPHNWVQPFLVGTYANRQKFPEEILADFQGLVDAGVVETDHDKRQAIYEELTQLDYDHAVAIRLAIPSGRRYEQRWVEGYYYNPGYSAIYYYPISKK